MTLSTPGIIGVSDDDLMRRVQAGSAEAFGLLYDRHAARAFRVARTICRNVNQAEDAVQDGFLSIWRGRSSYRPEAGSFQGWAMMIVRNRAVDSLRRDGAKTRPQLAQASGSEPVDPSYKSAEDEVVAADEASSLRTVLARLPDTQTEVITLAFFGQLSHTEIAQRLGLPNGTVKGRIRLGLKKLRTELATSTG